MTIGESWTGWIADVFRVVAVASPICLIPLSACDAKAFRFTASAGKPIDSGVSAVDAGTSGVRGS